MDQVLDKSIEKFNIGSLIKFTPISLAVFSFLLAWYLLRITNLNVPIAYDGGDVSFMSWLIKRQIDGAWYFNGAYSCFPFGSVFLDFPLSDTGNFLVIKLLGSLTHSYSVTLNLYYLLSFSVTSIVSYTVLLKLGINKIYALTGAILFTFLPFHFLRLAHLFYTWYFHIPIYIWFSFEIFSKNSIFFHKEKTQWKNFNSTLGLLILSCFGIYYAFFASIMFLAIGIAGSLKFRSSKNIISAILAVLILTSGILLNTSPNLIYSYKNNRNNEVAPRISSESEVYGLKLVQMLLPSPIHRLNFFRNINSRYSQSFPLVTENATASLGLIGSMGLLILLIVVVASPFFWFPVDIRLHLLGFLAIVLFLFSTIGGFSSIFALLITPMIRGWNRVSVFIGFISITAFLLCTEQFLKKFIPTVFLKPTAIGLCTFLIIFGVWDQTGLINPAYIDQIKSQFLSDQHFVQKIERLIPGGAVYQLPYTPFPEGIAVKNVSYLISFDLLRGYLHSSSLHWSSGGVIGRPGDLFYRKLALETLAQQIKTINTLGFNGVYIDRRGYLDHGAAVEKELTEILGNKDRVFSEDNNLSFFKL